MPTKLRLAGGHSSLFAPLERPRLYITSIQQSDDSLPQPRVVLFMGLAGSGKTVASKLYLQQLSWPVVVIELRSGDPHGWPVVQRALAQFNLPVAQPAAAIESITEPTVVVVDPLDVALDQNGTPSAAVSPWLSAMLANPAIHLVLVSRMFPLIPELALLAANGDVRIVNGQDLAFTPQETQALWQERQGETIPIEQAEQLVVQSGGLAAMVALACATGTIPAEDETPLGELMVEHTIGDLSESLRSLIVEMSVLDAISPSAIETLTGRGDGAQILRELRQRNLLISDRPAILHPLIRQALLQQLRGQRRRFQHVCRLAIDLALDSGDYQQAWRLAQEAQLWDEARRLILEAGQQLRQQGASRILIDWIQALPPGERDNETETLLARAQSDLGDLDGAVITLSTLLAKQTSPTKQREISIWLAMVKHTRGETEAADALVQPYLDEPALEPIWRARVYRIHAIALALSGREEEALVIGQEAIDAAEEVGERRLMAFVYQDHGVIGFRIGRYSEAERSLRLAERCWRELDNSPEIAITLNTQALIALARRSYAAAEELASEARICALGGGRLREAAVASSTCGDVALAQGNYEESLLHYRTSADDAQQSADFNLLAYSLAMQAHVARLQHNTSLAAQLLQNLRDRTAASIEEWGWIATGIAAAHLTLGLPPAIDELQHALEMLGPHESEFRGAVLILLAQSYWAAGHHQQALSVWRDLETMLLRGRGGAGSRLAPLAAAEPQLLHAVLEDHVALFARLATTLCNDCQPTTGIASQSSSSATLLQVRILGAEECLWQGRLVTLPKHGLDLLVLLLLAAPYPQEEEDLLRRIWGDKAVGVYALRKLTARVRAVIPDLITRSSMGYTIGIPRTAIDFDAERFLSIDLQTSPTPALLALAEAASSGCLAQHEAPWVLALRDQINRRLALTWLELGRRTETNGDEIRAGDAFGRAQSADPCSDLVARAAMQHALRIGDRSRAIQVYLRYQEALDEQLGVEPADDLQMLYRQALEP